MEQAVEKILEEARAHGQEHLFQFYDRLSVAERPRLIEQIRSVDFSLIDQLVADFIKDKAASPISADLRPAPVITLPKTPSERQHEKEAYQAGEQAFRDGRVAAFLVAGGQGTRLGLHGPKGAFVIGPITQRTLFQLHAEKITAL